MSLRRLLQYIGLMCCLLAITGCDKTQKPSQAAQKFIAAIKSESQVKEADSIELIDIKPVKYVDNHKRNPFSFPLNEQQNKDYPDTIFKTITLNELQLVGTVTHTQKKWAIFRMVGGNVVKMTVGMRIGSNHSLLTQITENEVKFKREINTSSGVQIQEVIKRLNEPTGSDNNTDEDN